MSVDLYFEEFDLGATLVNGRMAFGFQSPERIAEFFDFALSNPDHVYHGDGMTYPCSLLVERYIEPGNWSTLSEGDLEDALRRYGWLRDDGDGERLHTHRPPRVADIVRRVYFTETT